MATMSTMFQQLIDKVEAQAQKTARLQDQMDRETKEAMHWQQQAIDLRFECEKLKTRLAGAQYLLQGVLLGEDVSRDIADWVNVPFFEEQKPRKELQEVTG